MLNLKVNKEYNQPKGNRMTDNTSAIINNTKPNIKLLLLKQRFQLSIQIDRQLFFAVILYTS